MARSFATSGQDLVDPTRRRHPVVGDRLDPVEDGLGRGFDAVEQDLGVEAEHEHQQHQRRQNRDLPGTDRSTSFWFSGLSGTPVKARS